MDPTASIGIIIALLGLIGGGLLYWAAGRYQAQVEAARQWNAVPAVIQTAKLANLGKGKFAPRLTYSYSVGGTSYTGKRLQLGGVSMTRTEAEAVMAAYPAGSSTTVRYDPHRHDFAVLRPQADVKGYRVAGILVAASFVVTGLIVSFIA